MKSVVAALGSLSDSDEEQGAKRISIIQYSE